MTIFIPDDLAKEIREYLPAKSLARFKCVSKQWRSEIQSSSLKLLVVQLPSKVEEDSNAITLLLETFSRDYDNDGQIYRSLSSLCTTSNHSIDESKNNILRVLGSCDGLVLIGIYSVIPDVSYYDLKYIYIINPNTMVQRSLSLAEKDPLKFFPIAAGSGKDMITGTFKVILMYFHESFNNDIRIKITVLDLSNGEERNAGLFPVLRKRLSDEQASVFVNGSLFWMTLPRPFCFCLLGKPTGLVAMDLHTEKFRGISLPSWYTKYSRGVRVWSLNDRLCLSDVQQCSNLDVWSLQQENPSEKWEKTYSFNILDIGDLGIEFWTLGLAAAYFRRPGKGSNLRNHDSIDHLRTTLYTPTLISPYQL